MNIRHQLACLRALVLRAAPGRQVATPRAFRVTVPPALVSSAANDAPDITAVFPAGRAAGRASARREPASFLKTARHRLTSAR